MSDSKRSEPIVEADREEMLGHLTGSATHALSAGVVVIVDDLVLLAPRSLSSGREKSMMVRTITPEIEGCVNAVFTLLEVFGMDGRTLQTAQGCRVRRAFVRTCQHWQSCADSLGDGGWMTFAKWKFASFYHAHTQELAPPPPQPAGVHDDASQLAMGIAGRYALLLLRGQRHVREEFLASVLQIKKGCPRPTKAMVESQVEKSVEALTSVQPEQAPGFMVSWGDDDLPLEVETYLDRHTLCLQADRTVDELFGAQTYATNDKYRAYFPSTKSTNQDTQAQGGAFRTLRKLAHELKLTTVADADDHDGPSLVRFGLERSEEYIGAPRDAWVADTTELEARFGDLYEQALKRAVLEPALVKPVGLAEALKVRVITKGPPLTGFVLKPLQKFLWRTLAKHPTFELIGKPVDQWTVQNRLGARLPENEALLSGDYSAATDKLAPWLSERIARRIAMRIDLSADEETLLVRSLTQHVFGSSKGKPARTQQWGQLMGSVTSFPILCIANAVVCRWALELSYKKRMSLVQSPLLVNGDDCLMRMPGTGLKYWNRITSFGGLTPSVGKYFFSREFAQINSTNFQRLTVPIRTQSPTGVERDLWYTETPYVNLGLLAGLKRSGELSDEDLGGKVSLGSRCEKLIACAPERLKERLYKMFVKQNISALEEMDLPWYMPEAWGGVGLPILRAPTDPGEPEVIVRGPSQLDLRIAHRILERPTDFPVSRVPVLAPWDTHRIALGRMPDSGSISNAAEQYQKVNDRLYGCLVVDAMFTSARPFAPKPQSRMSGVLRANRRSWTEARHSKRLPAGLSLQTVLSSPPQPPLLAVSLDSIFI